jgi:hypothetical protein
MLSANATTLTTKCFTIVTDPARKTLAVRVDVDR